MLWQMRVPIFFMLITGQLIFFLLNFFDLDFKYAIFASSVSGMCLSLLFKHWNNFRLAMTLSIYDYGSYFSGLIMWLLLTSVIFHGLCVRLQEKYETYVISAKCGEKTVKTATSRAFQEGLDHYHRASEETFENWTHNTCEVRQLLQEVGSTMFQLSSELQKLSKLIHDLKLKCYKNTQSALMDCQSSMKKAKNKCEFYMRPFKFFCEILWVPITICKAILEIDVCHPLDAFIPFHQASFYLMQQAEKVENAMDLKVKSMSIVTIEVDYAASKEIYNDFAGQIRSVSSKTMLFWNIMGVFFAVAFIVKPIQNYYLVRTYKGLSPSTSVLTKYIMLGRILTCLGMGLLCFLLYAADIISTQYMCREERNITVHDWVHVSVNSSVKLSGGIVAMSIANGLLKEVDKVSNITVTENIYDCLPLCKPYPHYLEMTAVLLLLVGIVLAICSSRKITQWKLKLLDDLMMK